MVKNTIEKTRAKNPFAMFARLPAGVGFEGQEKGEVILLLLRAHIITLIPSILTIIFFIALPFFIGPLLGFINVDFLEEFSSGRIFWLILSWYIFVFGFTFYRFIVWYFNVYVLTNERIVDFDFRGILHKQISFTTLSHVEDVSPKTIGFFGTFFNFGNVYVQTAAERPEFEFENVAKPDDVAHLILEQVRHEEGEVPGEIS